MCSWGKRQWHKANRLGETVCAAVSMLCDVSSGVHRHFNARRLFPPDPAADWTSEHRLTHLPTYLPHLPFLAELLWGSLCSTKIRWWWWRWNGRWMKKTNSMKSSCGHICVCVCVFIHVWVINLQSVQSHVQFKAETDESLQSENFLKCKNCWMLVPSEADNAGIHTI